MSLQRVEITSDVFWTCVTHALTTEAEEIMGLLLGDIKEGPNGEQVARIWFAMPQIRTDRRKDRVEASPEQMVRCAGQAEEYSKQRGVRIRVIGWYHSHPHITVLPSHVDVRTQATYQQLDEGFVGLIFSTFDEDAASLAQRVQVTAFQSVPAASRSSYNSSLAGGSQHDYDAAMAAAMEASQCDHGCGDGNWSRKEVPLEVIQTEQASERSDNLFGLMRVLFREEQASYRRAVTGSSDKAGSIHPLAAIHFGATYQQHMCQLIELVLGPTVQALENYKTQVHLQMQRLKQLEAELKNKLGEAENQLAIEAEQRAAATGRRGSHLSAQDMDPQPSLAQLNSSSQYSLDGIQGRPGSAGELMTTSATVPRRIISEGGPPSPGSSERIREMRNRLERLKSAASPPPSSRGSQEFAAPGSPAKTSQATTQPRGSSPFALDKESRSMPPPSNSSGSGGAASVKETRSMPPPSSSSASAVSGIGGAASGGAPVAEAPAIAVTGSNPLFGAADPPPPVRRIMTASASRTRTSDDDSDTELPNSVLDVGVVNPLADSLDETMSIDSERPTTADERRERKRDKMLKSMLSLGGKAGGKFAKGFGKSGAGSSSKVVRAADADLDAADIEAAQDTPPESPDAAAQELLLLSGKGKKVVANEQAAKGKKRGTSLAKVHF